MPENATVVYVCYAPSLRYNLILSPASSAVMAWFNILIYVISKSNVLRVANQKLS